MKIWPVILGAALLAGCASFHPKPVSPAESATALESRSLTNQALKVFLETNLHREFPNWPEQPWDFEMLTLAAFYYHPSLDVARAQWHVAQAGIKSAGGLPNPTLTVTPGYSANPAAMVSPWFPAINFDLPIETAGKRGKRISQAEQLSEAARLNLASTAWRVRSDLRARLQEKDAAYQRQLLLSSQVVWQEEIVKRFEQQVQAGAVANSEITSMRVALQKVRVEVANAESDVVASRSQVAEAIGVSPSAVDQAKLSFEPLKLIAMPTNLLSAEVRDVALLSRTDVLSALAEYAAAEDALRLEIAKQYPDVHLNPGYQFDQGEHKWSLGFSVELPVLNQNQGPIAEAEARREEAAATFNQVQAKAIAEIDRAAAAYRISEKSADTLRALADESEKQRASVEAQFKAGQLDRLDLLNAQLESVTAQLILLDGRLKLQQAAGALEDAVQRPLSGKMFSAEESPNRLEEKK